MFKSLLGFLLYCREKSVLVHSTLQKKLTHYEVDVAVARGNRLRSVGEGAVSQIASSAGEAEDVAVDGTRVAEGGAVIEGLRVAYN